ncbi:unnamed protein product [Pieris brassicae]|uniref:Uncharacterized protein n=1 Tax=Pieris brassicae TaxID=7116 RepID=A0A9P0TLY5_PIEBR|nr:unnamed protein product [Pieris brassicae]
MVIEQYVNNLDFHVSLGVRIAKEEEARLALNKPGPSTFYNGTFRQKEPNFPQHSHNNRLPFPSRLHLPPTHPQFRPDNYVPQENNMTPEQRQQLVKSLLPWKNQQGGRSSGKFRKPLNIPQQGHHAHKNSDVTMRSVSKPQKPPYLIEEVFYTENNPYNSDPEFQGTCYNCYNSLQDESDVEPNSCQEEAEYNPDFHEAQGEEDRRPLTWLMSLKDPNSKLTRWRLKLAEYDFNVVYKKGLQNTNADVLSRVKIFHHSIDSLAVNLDDNEDDEFIGQIFENVRIIQQNNRQTDDEPMAGPSRQDDYLDPDVQLDPQSPSIAESAIDDNQLSEVELVNPRYHLQSRR